MNEKRQLYDGDRFVQAKRVFGENVRSNKCRLEMIMPSLPFYVVILVSCAQRKSRKYSINNNNRQSHTSHIYVSLLYAYPKIN